MRCRVITFDTCEIVSSGEQVTTARVIRSATDFAVEPASAVLGERAHDVALRDDAVDRRAVLADDRGADPLHPKALREMLDAEVGADGDDLGSLGLQDVGNVHWRSPL